MDKQEHGGKVVAVAAKSVSRLTRLIEELPSRPDVDRSDSLVVVGVADEMGWIASAFAPMSGGVTSMGMRTEMVRLAGEVAQQAVRAAPQTVTVRHFACQGWTDRTFTETLAAHGCYRLIVDRADLRPRQLRRVEMSAAGAGIELTLSAARDAEPFVVGDPPGRSLANLPA